jgi:hypothetical protein
VTSARCHDDHDVDEPPIDWDDESAIILALMRIDAKLEALLRLYEEDEDEDDEQESDS